MPEPTPSKLTLARRSLWDAIDSWPALGDGRIGQKLKMEFDQPLLDEIEPAGISDLPCIAIVPTTVDPSWFTNIMQKWPFILDVRIWTEHWDLPAAERMAEDVIDALWRSSPQDSSVPFVKLATGYYPERVGPVQFTLGAMRDGDESDGTRVVVTTLTVALRIHKFPFEN